MLFDYDIYTLSFMSDEDVEELYKTIKENGLKSTDKKLKDKLLAIRDNARVFVAIAEHHNSVRAYIDRIGANDDGLAALTAEFTGDGCEYRLRLVGPVTCKKFLNQF
jgi:3-methyladenine DNA glycosylase Tag